MSLHIANRGLFPLYQPWLVINSVLIINRKSKWSDLRVYRNESLALLIPDVLSSEPFRTFGLICNCVTFSRISQQRFNRKFNIHRQIYSINNWLFNYSLWYHMRTISCKIAFIVRSFGLVLCSRSNLFVKSRTCWPKLPS